jgi:hypothetical protein
MQQVIVGKTLGANCANNKFAALMGAYSWNATEGIVAQLASATGLLSNFHVYLSSAPGAGTSITFTIYVNGSPTSLAVTISDTAQLGSDDTHTAAVSAGQSISVRCTVSGAPTVSKPAWACKFTGSARQSLVMANDCASTTADNYNLPAGQGTGSGSGVILDYSAVIPTSGILKNLYLKIGSATPGTGKGWTVTLYKNGVATALACTATGTGGTANDTTHSVSVAAGDTIALYIERYNSPTSTCYLNIGMMFVPDVDGESLILFSSYADLNQSATRYHTIEVTNAGDVAWTATETDVYGLILGCTLKKLYVKLTAQPGVDKSYTFTVRAGSPIADTTLSCAVSGATDNNSDTAHSPTIVVDSYVSMKCVPAGSPAIADAHWGMVCYLTPPAAPLPSSAKALMSAGIV